MSATGWAAGATAIRGRARPSRSSASSRRLDDAARDAALILLGHRDRSAREVERRLLRKGFEAEVVAEVIEQLERHELVDDHRFARAWVEGPPGSRPYGPDRLAAALPLLALGLMGAAAPVGSPDAPEAEPQIAAVDINPSPVRPGGHVVVTVETSPNVVAVDAHVKSFTFHLGPVGSGGFRSVGTVPKIARFFKGTYRVTFVARCSGGRTTEYGEDVVVN